MCSVADITVFFISVLYVIKEYAIPVQESQNMLRAMTTISQIFNKAFNYAGDRIINAPALTRKEQKILEREIMLEADYRRKFAKLLQDECGGEGYHPADFRGIKSKQADILYSFIPFIRIEMKRWTRKNKAWSFVYEELHDPKQVRYYEDLVRRNIQVYYVVYRYQKGKHSSVYPDWIYNLNKRRYYRFEQMIEEMIAYEATRV